MEYGATTIHPVALAATVIAGMMMIVLGRRSAILPFIVVGIFIPMNQRIVLFDLDFMMMRILILFGWVRIIMRSELISIEINVIDKAIIYWTAVRIVTYTVLVQTSGAFINRLGLSFDTIGIYFLARALVRDYEDILRVVKAFAMSCVILAIFVQIEQVTARNLFSFFGGVPARTAIRAGLVRCRGPFPHSILAGVFAATLIPLFWALCSQDRIARKIGLVGGIAATAITINSASSGPVIAYFASITGICMWRLRKYIREICWVFVFMLIGLHISMKSPVWALIGRVNIVPGSTGYHRYKLIDEFINRFDEWWLWGTKSTAHWHQSLVLTDITNFYIRIAVDGGLVSLILFAVIIILCFKRIGLALRFTENHRVKQKLLWGLGASLFAHLVAFTGMSYWQQIVVLWYITLALIPTASALLLSNSVVEKTSL